MTGPVIAVSGPPGSGKTTLARLAASRLGGACIEYDRYETFTRQPLERTLDWLRRGAPYGEVEAPGLAEAIRAAAARGPVLVDTPLGRAHPRTGPLIDRAVWIDCPADIALRRKLAQLVASVPAGQAAGFLGWLRGYLDAYETLVRPACAIQAERLAATADLVLDGTADPARSAEAVCREVDAFYYKENQKVNE